MYDSVRKKKENIIMSESKQNFSIEVEGKRAVCPLGEVVGKKMMEKLLELRPIWWQRKSHTAADATEKCLLHHVRQWQNGPGRPTKSLLLMVVSCIVTVGL
jgi:hypothetical protein